MEACATSHFWGRFAQLCGHNVRLIPPIYVKPFVKRQKNDAADLTAVVGILADETNDLPAGVRKIGQLYLDQIRLLTEKIDGLMLELRDATRANEDMHRLCTVPGVGPVTAGAILAFAPDIRAFKIGRNFAAWLGLVPRQHSTGGKTRLGGVSKMGQTDI